MGLSEERIGDFIASKRDKVEVISKAGVDWHSNGRVNMSNQPKVISRMLTESLKRMNTDYIDVFYIHWPDPNVDIRYPLEVLFKAKEQHKILAIGLSNTNINDISLAIGSFPITHIQGECNLFNDVFKKLSTELDLDKIETQGWGTFDKGILAGSVTPTRKFDSSDCRSWAPWWKKSNWKEKCARVREFESLGHDIKSSALSYAYTRKYLTHPIIGLRTKQYIDDLENIIIDERLASTGESFFNE